MNLCLGSTVLDFRDYSATCLVDTATNDDCITAVEVFESNIYIGTTSGQILHYHRFEDNPEFILLSQQDVRLQPIKRIVVVLVIARVLVLCGNSVNVYSFPEASPILSGKLKDVEDIVVFPKKHQDTNTPYADAIVLTKTKLRVIRMFADQMKLIKDISCTNLIAATPHGSNSRVTVANDTSYDIIDVENTRRVPLFLYVAEGDAKVRPLMVSFDADGSQELLLTILSDKATSIGMFINEDGDVVRGTLPWPQLGYPNGGVAVDWPYVLGVHGSSTARTLVISSLVDFEVKSTIELGLKLLGEKLAEQDSEESNTGFCLERLSTPVTFEIASINSIMSKTSLWDSNKTLLSEKDISSSHIIIYHGLHVWALYCQNTLLELTQALKKLALGEVPEHIAVLQQLASKHSLSSSLETVKSYFTNLMFLHFLLQNDFDRLQTNVVESLDRDETTLCNLVYLIDKERQSDFWNEPRVFDGIKDVLDSVEVTDQLHELVYSALKQVYSEFNSKSKKLGHGCDDYLRYIIYGEFLSSEEVIQFVNSTDLSTWKTCYSAQLVEMLMLKEYFVAVVFLYSIIPLSELKPLDNEKVCLLIVHLLNGTVQDTNIATKDTVLVLVNGTELDLVDILLKHLSKVEDSKIYTDCLMEALRLKQDKGIAYMKKDINGMHKSSYGQILKDVYKLVQSEDFAHLKLEYLENTLIESVKNDNNTEVFVGELIDHLLSILKSSQFVDDSVVNNMMILYETYKIEQSLDRELILKTSWVNFLHMTMKLTECKAFIEVYLKLYELLAYERRVEGEKRRIAIEELSESPCFHFFKIAFLQEDMMSGFLKFQDYFSAEYYALFQTLPTLRTSNYPLKYPSHLPVSSSKIKENLRVVYGYYREQFEKNTDNLHGIRQFVKQYESRFTPLEIIDLLPDNISVVYFKQYLEQMLVNLNNSQRESLLRKTIVRRDVASSKQLYEDFTISHESM